MKIKKILSYALIGTTLMSNLIPAYANTQYTDSSETVEEMQNTSKDDNLGCDVYAELGSEFKVIIPKKVTLDGALKSGTYKITVEGDIAGTETITVKPDLDFTLSSKNLPDITASVSQDKINWKYNEILEDSKILGNGLISASNLSAGAWNGTFNFNISLTENSINVSAKNEAGEDINATAENIIGDEKEILLEELDKSGLAKKEDVDAIIEVNSDSFEGIAETTFDVSSIAKEGDTVVILHYDETKQEWEYIGTEIVDSDGMVTGNFTSYSPVVFVKIENNAPIHVHRYIETNLELHCTQEGVRTYTCACNDSYEEIVSATGHIYDKYSTDGTQHWKECIYECGEKEELTNHEDLDNDGFCDVCNYQGTIVYVYHTHNGTANQTYSNGCYTKPVTGTTTISQGGGYNEERWEGNYYVGRIKCGYCGFSEERYRSYTDPATGAVTIITNKSVYHAPHAVQVTTTIYNLDCGKTEETIESQYTIFE